MSTPKPTFAEFFEPNDPTPPVPHTMPRLRERWGTDEERTDFYRALLGWTPEIGTAIYDDPRVTIYVERGDSRKEKLRRFEAVKRILKFIMQLQIMKWIGVTEKSNTGELTIERIEEMLKEKLVGV